MLSSEGTSSWWGIERLHESTTGKWPDSWSYFLRSNVFTQSNHKYNILFLPDRKPNRNLTLKSIFCRKYDKLTHCGISTSSLSLAGYSLAYSPWILTRFKQVSGKVPTKCDQNRNTLDTVQCFNTWKALFKNLKESLWRKRGNLTSKLQITACKF